MSDSYVSELIGVACIDMSLIASESAMRAQSGWGAFQERVEQERTTCPRITLTEGQMETLRRRVSPQSMCGTTSQPSSALPSTGYTATGVVRACTEGSQGNPAAGINVGIIVGAIAALAVLLAIVIFMVKTWQRNQEHKRRVAADLAAG